jgi:hypothetical protein
MFGQDSNGLYIYVEDKWYFLCATTLIESGCDCDCDVDVDNLYN